MEKIGFWKNIINVQDFIDRAELISGLPYVNLEDFIYWKKRAGREKDRRDVILIEEYLLTKYNQIDF